LSPAVTRRLIGHFAAGLRTDRQRVARERLAALTDGATRPVDSQKRETGRALPRGVGGGSSTRPVSDQRPRGVDADVLELYTRPKATLLVQIFASATGLPGLEECHSMFPPA
jgi:hypothetical protein